MRNDAMMFMAATAPTLSIEARTVATDPAPRLVRKLQQYMPLTDRERAVVARLVHSKVQHLDPGVPLVEAGEPPSDVHVVLSGWACRSKLAANGRRQVTAFHLPGDVCDLGALTLPQMDSSIVALTGLRVGSISRSALRDFTQAHPRLSQALWWETASSASIQREWMVRICQLNARERIASLVCELAARLYAVDLADDGGFSLPLTQSDIGGACGLTPEHTNRTLRELREAGIMTIERGRLLLNDWDALRGLANFDGRYLHFRSLREAA